MEDDNYPDCFFQRTFSTTITVNVVPPEELNQLGVARPFGFMLARLVVETSIGFAVWVRLKENEQIVKAAQPIFLHLLCLELLIMGLSLVPLGLDGEMVDENHADEACIAFLWLRATGFSLAFSALSSKIWRTNQVFRASATFRRIHLRPVDVMLPFCLSLFLNFVVLLVWTSVESPRWTRV